MKRGLPSLKTTTKAAVTTTSIQLPKLTATSNGNSLHASTSTTFSLSTSSIVAPTLSPPSAKNNPNIWTSEDTDGTVFIAVGAVFGGLLLIILIWRMFYYYRSHKYAKIAESFDMEDPFKMPCNRDNTITNNGLYNNDFNESFERTHDGIALSPEHNFSKVIYDDLNNDTFDLSDIDSTTDNIFQAQFDPIRDAGSPNKNINKNALFISPTLEIIGEQQKRKSRFIEEARNPINTSPFSNRTTDAFNRPERSISPERRQRSPTRYHHKNNSLISLNADKSIFDDNTVLKFDNDNSVHIDNSIDKKDPIKKSTISNKTEFQPPTSFLDDMLES